MDALPIEILRKIYEYDSTYKIKFDKVLLQLRCFSFIYRCQDCFKPFNKCFCYCPDCRTFKRFCRQLYYEPGDMIEDELEGIIQMK